MSRTLSKILVACAMVVVLPLLIVGTAFAAYFSIDATVAVDVYTNMTSVSQEAYAAVNYNGKNETKTEIHAGHTKTITLKALSQGYDFKGWFAGSKEEYARAEGEVKYAYTTPEINVGMTEQSKLLAIFFIKEYSIKLSYKADPTSTELTTVEAETYYYGQNLPVLTFGEEGEHPEWQFRGWKIVGDASEKIYKNVAELDVEGEVTLTAVWEESTKISVNYYADDKTTLLYTAENIYEGQTYSLKSVEDILNETTVTGKPERRQGYSYAWKDSNGNALTSINSNRNVDVYMSENEITYKINVANGEASYKNETQISFKVTDTQNLNALFETANWTTDYSFHIVEKMQYLGAEYANASILATAVVANNPYTEATVTISPIVTKYLSTFKVTEGITGTASGSDVYKYYDLGILPWTLPATEQDSSKTIDDLLHITDSPLYIDDGTEDGKEVELSSLTMTFNFGSNTISFTIEISSDKTLNELIEEALKQYNYDIKQNVYTVKSIKANFVEKENVIIENI